MTEFQNTYEIGKRLCEAVGIDHSRVTEWSVVSNAREGLLVKVSLVPTDEAMGDVTELIRDQVLMDRDHAASIVESAISQYPDNQHVQELLKSLAGEIRGDT